MSGSMYTSFTDWNGSNRLEHFGIKGMKWGVRRYQNTDGSLTAEGQKRYSHSPEGLGYKPLKGKKGDIVQKRLGKNTGALEKKAGKLQAKAKKMKDDDGGVESDRYRKTVEKARQYTETAQMLRKMQATYASMAKSDRNAIRSKYIASRVLAINGGCVGAALAGGLRSSANMQLLQRTTGSKENRNEFVRRNAKGVTRGMSW